MTALRPGDATFAKSFTRISYSECGSFSQTLRFSAGKGRKFVTMVLGDVDAKETFADVDKMLNELGYYWREAPQHPDDAAVDRFTEAMKAKLAEASAKGRHGWEDPQVCSVEFLSEQLVEHVAKGNAGTFEDIANFAMMLHQRGADPATLAGVFRCMLPELQGAPVGTEREGFEALLKRQFPYDIMGTVEAAIQGWDEEHQSYPSPFGSFWIAFQAGAAWQRGERP